MSPIIDENNDFLSTTPFNGLLTIENSKMLITLISTLNASYPDYDFRHSNDYNFIKKSNTNDVIKIINDYLIEVFSVENLNKLWVSYLLIKEKCRHSLRCK
jgi:hypothetical protein